MEEYRRLAAKRHEYLSSGSVALNLSHLKVSRFVSVPVSSTIEALRERAARLHALEPQSVKILGLSKARLPSPDAPLHAFPIVKRWIDRFLSQGVDRKGPGSSDGPAPDGPPPIRLQVLGSLTQAAEEAAAAAVNSERSLSGPAGDAKEDDDEAAMLAAAIALSLEDQPGQGNGLANIARNHGLDLKDEKAIRAAAQPARDAAPDQKRAADQGPPPDAKCRICFEGPELGPMFTPCLCRGSMALVHVECLNQWRRSSANPESYFRCEQCHYEYQLRRAWYAGVLLDNRLIVSASVALLLALLLIVAAVSSPILGYLEKDLARTTYELCEWEPFWLSPMYPFFSQRRESFDFLVTGLLVLGSVGFLHWMYAQYEMLRHTADGMFKLLIMAAFFFGSQAGFQSARMAIILGLFMTLRHLHGVIKDWCARIAQVWGERILEITPEEREAALASQRQQAAPGS